ncbi:MAG: hypothetical protein LKG27_00935 [Clostridiaceae bacterium]|jgi:hypothetical protein|nr:hypothetical protein [Clostridiaceae bacterium]
MYLLITIVFIAELIIALTLILSIVKADRYVTEMNTKIITGKNTAAVILVDIKKVVLNLRTGVNTLIDLIKRKKREYSLKVMQTVILYALMIFCKGKYKKAAIVFQLMVAINDYMHDSEN